MRGPDGCPGASRGVVASIFGSASSGFDEDLEEGSLPSDQDSTDSHDGQYLTSQMCRFEMFGLECFERCRNKDRRGRDPKSGTKTRDAKGQSETVVASGYAVIT
jgi:hypothetical protein